MPKPKLLTDKTIEKAKAAEPGKRYCIWDSLVPNFGVRITDKKHRTFIIQRRLDGKMLRRVVGVYGAITLSKARDDAREMLREITKGIDPKTRIEAERRQKEANELAAEKQRRDSFAAILSDFDKRHLSKRKSGPATKQMLERELLPRWAAKSVTEISRRDVIEAIDAVADRGSPISANRLLAHTRKLFNWCMSRGILDNNPAHRLEAPGEEQERDRVLSAAEIAVLWEVCGELGYPLGPMVKLLLATGQRLREVAGLKWSDLDLDARTWRIARKQTKADRSHEVPLSDPAIDILMTLPHFNGEFVLTTTGGRAPVSGFSKFRARLEKAIAARIGSEGAAGPFSTHWTLHDLRRTVATNMGTLKVDRRTISKVLNHKEGGITRLYDRASYLDEKRAALDLWGRQLDVLIGTDRAIVAKAIGQFAATTRLTSANRGNVVAMLAGQLRA